MAGLSRRETLGASLSFAVLAGAGCTQKDKGSQMYGMIGKITATAETRDQLIGFLLEGSKEMPGCLSYIVAKDAENPAAVWVTEVWRSKADHAASLELESVKAAIGKARPLIQSFDVVATTEPIGGKGV